MPLRDQCKPHFNFAADDTVVLVAEGNVELWAIEAENPNADDMWLNIWDRTDDSDVTVGATDPDLSYLIPAGDGSLYGAMDKNFALPIGLVKGFCYAVTDAVDGGSAPAVNCVVNIAYRKVRTGT